MKKTNDKKSNVSRFKEILLELHRGVDPVNLYDEFHEIIAAATADECEEIRLQLVIEGVPKKRAKKWSRHLIVRNSMHSHAR